jgi:Tfp pilus assembly protein PilO
MQQVCTHSALIPELKQQRDRLSVQLAPFDQKIPTGRNFAQLWQQIADVMNACNLSDQLVQPGLELKSDRLCSIPLTIECKGTLEQIFAFFQSLEGIDRLIRIEEVKLENDAAFDAAVKLSAKASVYYQPDEMDNG